MSILGSSGGRGAVAELGLGSFKDFVGLNLKGKPPQWNAAGSTLLTKTYAFEILPIRQQGQGAQSHVFFFSMNPTQLSFTDFSSSLTTYTAGGVVLEGGATLLRQYTLTGRSGTEVRRGYSAGEIPSVAGASHPTRITADGHRLFREMHKFFKHYSDIKSDPVQSHSFALAFHDFVSDDHFIISPNQFSVDRRGNSDYSYTITFDAVADRIGFELNLLNQLVGLIQGVSTVVSTTVNNMAGMLDDITNSVAEMGAIVGESLSQVSASLNRLNSSIELAKSTRFGYNVLREAVDSSWKELKDSISALGGTLDSLTDSAKDNAREGAQRVSELAVKIESEGIRTGGLRAVDITSPEIDVIRERLVASNGHSPPITVDQAFNPIKSTSYVNARRSVLLLENSLFARLVQEEAKSESVSRDANASLQDSSREFMSKGNMSFEDYSSFPTISVPIFRGDSIKSICLRHVGSFDAVEYVCKVNNLKFPYISETGEPFTLMYGQTILVPSFRPTSSGVLSRPQDSIDRALFGEDFKLTSDGDMVLSNDLNDFTLISGIPNLKQALEVIKFRTKLGTNPLFPQIGFPDLIGEPSSEENVLSAYMGAKLVATEDSRVSACKPSAYWDKGDTVNIMLECRTVNSTDTFEIGVIR